MIKPAVYFNDNEQYCCDWLENLYPDAFVDCRDIQATGNIAAYYDRVHLFAGIGGWEYALQLAGWPEDRPIWTGSPPCQPFSTAGKRKGIADARHLWPDMLSLIDECRPPVVFGEQVASKDGRLWLSGVRADLEALGYAVGAADLCAAGLGAPHIRQRLYWVAYTERPAAESGRTAIQSREGNEASSTGPHAESGRRSDLGGLGDPNDERSQRPWGNFSLVECADGKTRRFEPESFPLAHGVPARVGKLRAYGNAIVAPLAAEFIKAFLEAEADLSARPI